LPILEHFLRETVLMARYAYQAQAMTCRFLIRDVILTTNLLDS